MKLFKNKKGFSDVITVTLIGGIIGSLFILGVFVWKEVEKYNYLHTINNKIIQIINTKDDKVIEEDKGVGIWQTYTNKELGFTVKYPQYYSISESDKGVYLETIYEKPKDVEIFMGGGASVNISFATDENNSGPYFTDSFIEENPSLKDFSYYTWAKKGFLEDSEAYKILAFFGKETININGNVFTVFNLASGMDSVKEYFLFKDGVLINITDNRLGGSTQELNEKIISTFKFLEKDNTSAKTIDCLPEQRATDVCTAIYQPVCAIVNVQCITAPCLAVKQTFGNSCEACSNSLVSAYTAGECK